jgi:predicted Fe-Mo cluster-binding NifX family protein
MKIAIPEWQGRVSPVFDVAERIWIYEIDANAEHRAEPEIVSLRMTVLHDRAQRLVESEVRVLICGAISAELEELLISSGICVVPLVCGEIGAVVQAYRAEMLTDDKFSMPGCQVRTRRRRRRRGTAGPERKCYETGRDDSAT